MISQLTSLNWMGVLLAFMVYFILGALWFTLLFAKQYKISLGRGDENLQNKAPIFIVGPAVCALVITLTTAILIHALQIQTIKLAIEFALLIGVGYLVANTINIAINPNMPRPIHYGIITGFYHLTGILLVSCILTAMN